MSDISRRTFMTTGASLVATSASLMMLREAGAAIHDGGHDPRHEPHRQQKSSVLHTSGEAATMKEHHMSKDMQYCIQLCHDCQAVCTEMIGHCLQLGGQYAAPDHIRLIMDCAQLCAITADYMARGSSFHDRMCGLCAEICQLCAESCDRIAGEDQTLKQCAELCRRCAGSCERMASKAAA